MAYGISPRFIQEMPLNNLSAEQFIVYAIEAAKYLDWNIGLKSEKGFIAYSMSSLGATGEEITVRLEGNIAILKSKSLGGRLSDWGKNRRNIQKFTQAFEHYTSEITPEEFALKSEELRSTFAPPDEDIFAESQLAADEKMSGILSIFKPIEGYFITPILIDVNIGVFILMVLAGVDFINPSTESLVKWGANFGVLTLNGEWWRLLTCCFVHAGILHLLFNMYALIYIGLLLEPRLGKLRFTAAYLLSGIGASLTSLWWNNERVSIGASGAIFGLYGVFLAMLTTNLIEKTARRALLTSIAVFVGYNLLNGLKGGIDNSAHIGGLITGLIAGYVYYPGLTNQQTNSKYTAVGILSACLLVVAFYIYHQIPNDIGIYEQKALELYHLPQNASNDTLSTYIAKGINYWQEDLGLTKEIDKLNIPSLLHERNKKIERYCELRLAIYELAGKNINENTTQYTPQINEYSSEVQNIVNDLSQSDSSKQ